MLKCTEVSKRFGGLQALKNVDFTVNDGEIAGLVGPNGSGKSTFLNLISGVYKPDSGQILFLNQDISKLPPYKICAKGITKTAQTVQSFPEMTATENVLTSVLFNEKKYNDKTDALPRAQELLEFVGLSKEKFDLPAKKLNVVELRRIQLAKALATNPKLLLLDELLTGLTPKESDEAIELIKTINKQGVTVLIVEHVMRVIMGLCSRVIVLHHGEKICEGDPKTRFATKTLSRFTWVNDSLLERSNKRCWKSRMCLQLMAWCKYSHDVNFKVEEGEIVSIIGPNGAGKTTLVKTIMGFLNPKTGSVKFKGENIEKLPTYDIVKKGLTMIPEGREIFPRMTVDENLLLGAYNITDKAKDKRN